MRIADIFSKDLFRPINGVVKAEQQDEAIVWQELEEYVITKELDQHFRRFFESYLNALANAHDPNVTGRIGVWVSGFFGSGKSHFIKILSYLLNNREAHEPRSGHNKRAVEFFEGKIQDPMLLADVRKAARTDTDVILFNIDSKADPSEGRGAILSVFWRVFNEMQGFCGEFPHIAEMERYLSAKGKYETFCAKFQEISGDKWKDERDAFHFRKDEVVEALSSALGLSTESAEDWFEKSEETFSPNIETLAKRVKEYLDRQGESHRIIFLVDEVGQFIGNDVHLMLNIQTITEELGRICQGRAWVVVTSQEDIDAVLGDLKSTKANDFSKIQGRFTTRLSLSSSNTDEVIQVRLLEKKPTPAAALENLFREKGDIIKSQLCFTHDSATLKGFKDTASFVANYPFAPCHFQLVQKVFESIRKAGATGLHLSRGERSMLDAFQSAAKNIADKEIGALVPLYEFYPAIESFLDTAVKKTIDQAKDNDGLEKPFDVNLLRTLFLIRYVDIIKPNVDNIVTLFIDQVDTDKLSLKRRIEEGLQRLEKETLISRNGDLYFFLTNEERDVSREIKSVDITSSEEIKFLAETIFADILKDQNKFRYKPNRRDYGYNRLLDGHPYGTKLDQEIGLEVMTPLSESWPFFNDMKCVMYSGENYGRVLVKLPDSRELERELRLWLQTDKYIRQKSDSSLSATFKRILRDRQEQNRERKGRITTLLVQLLLEAEVYALGQTLEINVSSPRILVDEALEYVVQNLYNKFSYLKTLHDEPIKEIRAELMSNDIGQKQLQLVLQEENPEAVHEVREFLKLNWAKNHQVTVKDLVDHFSIRPFGWPDWEIVLLAARLFMAGEVHLVEDSSKLEPREAIDPLSKTVKWKTVRITARKTPTKEEIDKARKHSQELFGKIGPESPDELAKTLRKELSRWHTDLSKFSPLAQNDEYPGGEEIEQGLAVISKILSIRDTFEFILAFNKRRDDLKDTAEDIHQLIDFYTNQRPTWERMRTALTNFKKNEAVLAKDPNASPALSHLYTIAEAKTPYGMVKDVDGLIGTVSKVNDELVGQRREKALLDMDSGIQEVIAELDAMKAGNDFRNQVLHTLQDLKKTVAGETSIPNITYHLEEFDRAKDTALDAIEKEKEPKGGGEQPRPVKTIKTSSVYTKTYLDSQEDVEAYVAALMKRLLEEIKSGARIRLQ